ncbi:dihydroorotate dehydrogenase [Saitoella coloradoensis]
MPSAQGPSAVQLGSLLISPPLINSSCPWASSLAQLAELYECPYTGAVTIRTSTPHGFQEDSSHSHTLFGESSINSYGFSPVSIGQYLIWIEMIHDMSTKRKPWLISIGGPEADLEYCFEHISCLLSRRPDIPIGIELNLSCPNIPSHPPPAYSAVELAVICALVSSWKERQNGSTVGIKIPPYTHSGMYDTLFSALLDAPAGTIDYIAATNTLGNSILPSSIDTTLSSGKDEGPVFMGGMAGSALHPLSLGVVRNLRTKLREQEYSDVHLRDIKIIGIGGVSDREGFERMRYVGADVVAVATALGREGVDVFQKILEGTISKEGK